MNRMKLAIITHVNHIPEGDTYWAYSAYVREMNIWGNHASQLIITAPKKEEPIGNIHLAYTHDDIRLLPIPAIEFTSVYQSLRSVLMLPIISYQLWNAMRLADHIHLRCPGTIGLLGCFVQMLFPKKPKTAKYAGNWDPNAKQPLSYRLQKKLLSNTFITRNMKVLVYGEWENQTKNIVPFFTASYRKNKIYPFEINNHKQLIQFIFVGTLSPGKRPLYALEMVKSLVDKGVSCTLDFYGEGVEREALEAYIGAQQLQDKVMLHGNQTPETVERAYRNSNYLILPSKSEGWPKVVAEAMFWGCIPIVTAISCVPWMLDQGKRGILLSTELEEDVNTLLEHIEASGKRHQMAIEAKKWSQQYTLDAFENEIEGFLK